MATTKTGVTAVSTTEKKTPGESGGHKAQPTEQGDASSKIKVETEEKKKKIRVDLNKVPGERRDAQRRPSKEKLGTNNDEVKTALKSRNSKDTPVTNDVMPVDLLSEIPTPPEIKLPNSQVKTDNHVDESKTGVVSFSFKKIGAKISTVGVFGDMGANRKSVLPNHDGKSEPVEGDAASPTKSLLSAFIKVSSKEDIPLDWPEEMIQYTNTEPKISFSCNPLCFDFTQLLTRNKKVDGVIHEETKEGKAAAPKTELLVSEQNDKEEESDIKESVLHTGDIPQTEEQIVIAEREAVLKQVESGVSLEVEGKEVVEKIVKKKRKRSKHKKHHPDGPQDEKKKHSKKKKKKKKHKQNKTDLEKKETGDSLVVGKKMENLEDYDGDLEGEDVDKSKSRSKKKKKSKKSKRKKKRKHTSPHPSVEEKEAPEKNKKSRKSLNSVKSSKTDDHSSTNGSDNESKKDSNKRKKKKRKHRHDERSSEKDSRQLPNSSNCIAVAEMEFAGDLVVEKLPAVVKESNENEKIKSPVNNNLVKGVDTEKHSSSVRKRQTSESSVPGTPSSAKKLKLTPKRKIEEIKTVREKSDVDEPSNVSDVPEDSWSKMEEIYEGKEPAEMQKSKWDTSDSESESVLDKLMSSKSSVSSIKTESVSKNLCTVSGSSGVTINKSVQNVGPPTKTTHSAQDNSDPGNSVPNNPDSNSTNPSVSSSNAGDAHSASRVESSKSSLAENASPKKPSSLTRSRSRKISTHSRSASSDSSGSQTDDSYHSRRKRRRSYSKDSYRSHSSHRSYSSSSYSHSSHSRSRSYSRSRSRSHSRRSRSRSYSSYSESDRSSRSRSRSSRRHYSRSSRSRSRSYSSRRRSSYSSYSSRSRSRSRSRTSRSKKRRRSRRSRSRHSVRSSRSPSINGRVSRSKNKREKKTNASPLDIPLPNLDKEETVAPQKLLQKIKEKKQQHSDLVKKGISNAKKSDKNEKKEGYIDIPLPTLTDNLKDAEPCDQNVPVPPGFPVHPPPPPPGYNPDPSSMDHQCRPGGMMAPPPPPPPGHGNMHPPHRMPHMGGPRPYMGPPGPGPGPRFFPPPHHRMRPPNRMGPPPMHNPPGRPPFPRNQYSMRPPMRHPPPPHMLNCGPPPNQQDYQMKPNHIPEVEEGPPPLPPPKSPSPQPPPLPKEEEKKTEEPTQNPSIVIPPEQAEQYRRLQEQAQKHAKRQLRKQKQEKGEAISDSSSEEEDDVDELSNPTLEEEAIMEQLTPTLVSVPVSHPLALQQPTLMLAQPQPSASPLGGLTMSPHLVQASPQPQILIPTSGGAHFSLPHGLALPSYSHPSLSHAVTLSQSVPFQTGQPIIAVPGNALAAAGAQPAHLGALPTQFHLPGMHPAGFPISAASHPLLAHSPFMASQIPGGIPLSSPFQQTMLTQGAIPGSPYGAAGLPQGLIGHHLLGGLGGLGGGQVIRIIRPHL